MNKFRLTYDRWETIAYFLVICLGIVLAIVGMAGAGTHVAPDCPGPAAECFAQINATLNAEVQR